MDRLEEIKKEYDPTKKPCRTYMDLEDGRWLIAEVERLRKLFHSLGIDFGFEEYDFSPEQVIDHAHYLQNERARLLYENTVSLKKEVERLHAEMAALERWLRDLGLGAELESFRRMR